MAIINTNISSINAQNNLARTQGDLQTSLQRLSSGLRINSAKDDAAGLAITNRQTSQIRGLNQAVRNANDGISVAQVAEGAMQESTNILQRMRELALQAANGTNSSSDRAALQQEVAALQEEFTRIAATTSFGTQKLLDGSYGSQSLQVGFEANQTVSISLQNISADAVGGQRITGAGTLAGTVVADGATPANEPFTAGDITLTNNATQFAAQVAVTATDQASDIAGNVNSVASSTGISATAFTEVDLEVTFGGGTAAVTFTTSEGAVAISGATSLQDLVDGINGETANTGLAARIDAASGNLRVTSDDGYNIEISQVAITGGTGDDVVINSVVDGTVATDDLDGELAAGWIAVGSVRLDSTDSFAVSGGPTAEVFGATASTLSDIDSVDINTASGAQDALAVIDGALATIDASRANLGALQNRLESTISNLSNISENVSAARSRILDANFAQETANLTRIQILQQAGTSILAQANAAPQSVLTLLQ